MKLPESSRKRMRKTRILDGYLMSSEDFHMSRGFMEWRPFHPQNGGRGGCGHSQRGPVVRSMAERAASQCGSRHSTARSFCAEPQPLRFPRAPTLGDGDQGMLPRQPSG